MIDAKELATKTCGKDELTAIISLWTYTIKQVQCDAIEECAKLLERNGYHSESALVLAIRKLADGLKDET